MAPKELEGDARKEWDRMVERLSVSKIISVVDAAALYQHCQLFAETEAMAGQQVEVGASVVILEENIRGLQGSDLVTVFQEIAKLW